jgi:site-specific recombinase XerD
MTPMTADQLRDLARSGAELTLKRLRAEIVAIERTFRELAVPQRRRSVGRPVKEATRRTRRMSAAARRHTFRSHLAMRGAPARAIQELAGHMDLSTTQRYMHLSPAAIDAAIRLLDGPSAVPARGEIVEAAGKRRRELSHSESWLANRSALTD